MNFLANENIPLTSVRLLRGFEHDIVAIVEDSPGAKDEDILQRACTEKRIILTFDRDYGELIYKKNLPVPSGVVLFRFIPVTPEEPAERLSELLQVQEISLDGQFTIVEKGRVRQRPLPPDFGMKVDG